MLISIDSAAEEQEDSECVADVADLAARLLQCWSIYSLCCGSFFFFFFTQGGMKSAPPPPPPPHTHILSEICVNPWYGGTCFFLFSFFFFFF